MHNQSKCHYTGDLHAVFVETDGPCSPLKMGVTIKSDRLTLSCQSSARVDAMLLSWTSTYGKVRMLSVDTTRSSNGTRTYCMIDNEVSDRDNALCHDVVYCYVNSGRRNRVVCRSPKGFYRRNKQLQQVGTRSLDHHLSSKSLQSFCSFSVGH